MGKARGKEEEDTLAILASYNSSSLVDAFLGRLLLFPFPIVEELVEYTISSFSTLFIVMDLAGWSGMFHLWMQSNNKYAIAISDLCLLVNNKI